MNIPKIGDRVEATMDGETWFRGEYKENCDLFCEFGVLTDFHKELRYFVSIRPVCVECERKDGEIKTLQETIDQLNDEIHCLYEERAGEDL